MALNYLLSPEFQISVTSGKPDTGGWIEVFQAGTRTKYITSCDFNGTQNPFRVPLDSLGQALILAEVGSLYDVFVYNRYGTLLFSRYNVAPQDGGAISTASITSDDGSITVTQTEHGVDLSVNGHEASVLRATATTLTSDGRFTFTRLQKTGDAVDVGQQGDILAKQGWFHYDVTVKYRWDSTPSNQSVPVTLSTNVGSSVGVFDLSYAHDVTDTLSGEWRSNADSTEFHVDVSGIPQGMTVEVVDFGIHAINGGGSGSGGSGGATYTGVDGIIVDNDNDEIKPDFDVLQHKLTEGSNIDITDNVISADVPTAVSELQNDVGYITSADLPTIPVTDVTVDGTSVVVNGVAEITMPTPPTIPVTDVTVDGTSVVVNGIAEITMPDLSGYATDAELTAGLATKQNTISDLSDIRAGAAKGDTAVQPGDLATVATSGNYNDLTNKPDLSIYAQSANLATVATTGSYDDLSDKPTIPAAQVNSDWNSNSGVSQILNKPQLATVATTGDYSDLVNTPSIPAAQVNADWNSSSGVSEILNKPDLSVYATDSELTAGLATKQDAISDLATIRSGAAKGDTAVQPGDLAAVATSGSYTDLSDKPPIPTVDQTYNASSANAQSGTAVAQALAGISVDEVPPVTSSDDGKVLTADYYQGVGSYSWEAPQNQVPSSTPADYGKVLTVTSVGGLSWEEYESAGSLDPGDLNLGNFIVRLRFGDTSYDPLSQSYASSFDSITRVSDGVYDFVFDTNRKNMRSVFSGVFTDITNNPVDILYIKGWNTDYTGPYMREMFKGCTGLRSIWNMNGLRSIKNRYDSLDYGNNALRSMFEGCTNLQEVHTRRDPNNSPASIYVGPDCHADRMFYGCTSLRIADIQIWGYTGTDRIAATMSGGFSNCTSMTAPPIVAGTWSDLGACFSRCQSLVRFDQTPLRVDYPNQDYGVIRADSTGVNVEYMFYQCYNLKNILPMGICGPVSQAHSMFEKCIALETTPVMQLAQNCDMSEAFEGCDSIVNTPEFDYTKIQNARRMFYFCRNLQHIGQKVQGLSTSATTVEALFDGCYFVVDGTLDCYNALSQSSTIQNHSDTFRICGAYTDFSELSSIPTSWGGTAT